MPVKTRKIKLIPTGDSNERKEKLLYVKDIASTLSKIGNEVIRLHVCNQYAINELTNGKQITKGQAAKILETKLGTSIRNSGYQLMSAYPQIPSDIRTGFNSAIYKTISNKFYEILNGKESIPSFRNTYLTIPISARNDKETRITRIIKLVDDDYILTIPSSRSSEIGSLDFRLHFGRDKSNNRVFVDRIMDGTYKLCDSNILRNDNDLIFLMCVDMPVNNEKKVNVNKVMGIDIGINRPVSIHIKNEKHQPAQIEIGSKIQFDRIKHSKKRQQLQAALKFTNGGHGRKKKMKALDNLRDQESNWATTMNHKISKEVVDLCLKYEVGLINMEDLTGITAKKTDYFLKSWKFFELQTFIQYKAEAVGIKINWVNPAFTSLTCPVCLVANSENRKEKDKTIFKCTNELCSCHMIQRDADIVAAENISNMVGTETKLKSKKGRIETAKAKKQALELVEG